MFLLTTRNKVLITKANENKKIQDIPGSSGVSISVSEKFENLSNVKNLAKSERPNLTRKPNLAKSK